MLNNTTARIAAGKPWAFWGYKWADKAPLYANSNTIPISLAAYQNAGSCTVIGMPAADCPRPLGALTTGKSMQFRVAAKNGDVFTYSTPITAARP